MEFSKLGLETFSEKNLFVELIKRQLIKKHRSLQSEFATKLAEEIYSNSEKAIDDFYNIIE